MRPCDVTSCAASLLIVDTGAMQSASKAENVCLTGLQISSVDLGSGCNASFFQIGFLDDFDLYDSGS